MKARHEIKVVEIFAGTHWECSMVKSLLGDACIEAFVQDEIMGTLNPWWTSPGGAGPIRVVISDQDVEMAKPIVNQYLENQQQHG